jgi:sugar/nucleoside kinase (ribokinase family)
VVLVGDVMTDVVARLDGPLVAASDSPARISAQGGGAAANTASWLARLGTRPVLLGRIGADPAGHEAARSLRSAGVEVRCAIDPRLATGTVIVLVAPGGERTMVPDPGANAALAPRDLPADAFVEGRHLHLSGYTLLRQGSREAGLAALASARAAGMTVSVDAASVGPLAQAGAGRFLEWVGRVDVLFANRDEAAYLTAAAALGQPEAWARQLAEFCDLAVVKLAAGGADACSSTGVFAHADALAIGPGIALDSTGAGDAFAAGFLAAWLAGAAVRDALRAGCSLAAQAVGRVGARPTGPRPADTAPQPHSDRRKLRDSDQ